jgi:HJR/Mrr/RecB family endonuclease
MVANGVGRFILGKVGIDADPNLIVSLLVGGIVLAAAGWTIAVGVRVVRRFLKWRRSWQRCPHRVPGGLTRHKCSACARNARLAEEARVQAAQAEERRREIHKAADDLVRQERERLAASLVPSLAELRALSPQRFEDEIAEMFKRLGFEVKQTPYVNDMGRDAIMKKKGKTYLLECKRYGESGTSGRPELQKFYAAILDDGAVLGYFVTTGSFTKGAVEWAATKPIELIDGTTLLRRMLESKPLVASDDSYKSLCRQCGRSVIQQLRVPAVVRCEAGHEVEPTLTVDDVLADSAGSVPICPRCGGTMRLINGRKGKFWGCRRYPECHGTVRWQGGDGGGTIARRLRAARG